VARHRADLDRAARGLDPDQVLDGAQIDQVRWRRKAQLHRLDQALAAREVLGFFLLRS
jgi:hypothetical protein